MPSLTSCFVQFLAAMFFQPTSETGCLLYLAEVARRSVVNMSLIDKSSVIVKIWRLMPYIIFWRLATKPKNCGSFSARRLVTAA